MSERLRPFVLALLVGATVPVSACNAAERTVIAPAPRVDAPSAAKSATAVFAGGCFWGIEGVFSHVKGVTGVVSGYAGPSKRPMSYALIGGGDTGFAEAVRVTYDPAKVSYGTLLRIFFSVGADPTTLNYQGPDHGTQYRSALFPLDAGQAKAARAYLAQLGTSGLWKTPIVTRVETLVSFQPAEAHHQDFLERNPGNPYIRRWDAPKIAALKAGFPQVWSEKAAR